MATPAAFKYRNIAGATTVTCKSGRGVLHSITVNKWITAATIGIYDNTAASGTLIGTITLSTAQATDVPCAVYDVRFATGLTLITSGATDVTVAYA